MTATCFSLHNFLAAAARCGQASIWQFWCATAHGWLGNSFPFHVTDAGASKQCSQHLQLAIIIVSCMVCIFEAAPVSCNTSLSLTTWVPWGQEVSDWYVVYVCILPRIIVHLYLHYLHYLRYYDVWIFMIFFVHHMFIISLSYVYQIFISVSWEFANCNRFASQQVRVCKTGTQSPSGPRPRAGSKGSHRLGAWRISSCAPASETLLTYDGIYVCASCTCSFAWPCCVYESNIQYHP